MPIILIFALIASIHFARLARAKGASVPKARIFPWLAAFATLAGGYLFVHLADFGLRALHASGNVRGFFAWAANAFFILAYLAVITRAKRGLQALPDPPQAAEP
jgi:hypothetical protein